MQKQLNHYLAIKPNPCHQKLIHGHQAKSLATRPIFSHQNPILGHQTPNPWGHHTHNPRPLNPILDHQTQSLATKLDPWLPNTHSLSTKHPFLGHQTPDPWLPQPNPWPSDPILGAPKLDPWPPNTHSLVTKHPFLGH
jgi:hypothetical protein